jgi:hypothetical protein
LCAGIATFEQLVQGWERFTKQKVDVSLPWTEGREPEWYHFSHFSLSRVKSFVKRDLYLFFVTGTGYKNLTKSPYKKTKFLIFLLKRDGS